MKIIENYISHGLSLCAIPPGTKGPTTTGWNLKENTLTSTIVIPEGYGLGLCHAYSGTMALDIDSMEMATTMLEAAGVDLQALLNAPDAVKVNSGRPGRGKLIYRVPAIIGPLRTKKISIDKQVIYELRCATADGLTMQDCIYPTIHPDTGKQYQWEGDWKNLPTIPTELLNHWIELIDQDKQRTINTGEGKGSVNASWEEIELAVYAIDPNCSREDWFKVGTALHWAGAQTGELRKAFDLWDSWSQGSPDKYPGERKIYEQWQSFKSDKANRITLGTLFHIAKEHCWKRPQVDVSDLFRTNRGKAGLLTRLDESGEIKPLPTVIQGFLPADAVGMLWGEPGSYKSFIVTDWMLSVASGRPWCGRKTHQGPVWYLAGEGHGGLRQRIAAWRKAKHFDGDLPVMHSSKAVTLDTSTGEVSDGLSELLGFVRSGEVPSMIVVDTLARSMVGDENSTRDASRFVSAIDELMVVIRSTGRECCLILVHHARKGGDDYRGSSALRGAVDFEFEVKKLSNLNVSIKSTKTKDGESPPDIHMKGKVVSLGFVSDNHGDASEITSLVFDEVARVDQKLSFVDKAIRMAPKIVGILNRDFFKSGASKRTLTTSLRHDGIRLKDADATALFECLEDHGFINIVRSSSGWAIWPSNSSHCAMSDSHSIGNHLPWEAPLEAQEGCSQSEESR